MKMLVLGCGGIGSWFCHFLAFGIRNSSIDCVVTVADGDIVEGKNLLYSNFDLLDLGKNKAEVLAKKYHFDFIPSYLKNTDDLKKFDLAIVATDDGVSRKMVFESSTDWIDMRAKGRAFAVFVKGGKSDQETISNLDVHRKRESCQEDFRIKVKIIDNANMIAASVGYQIFLNYLRGELSVREFRGYV